MKRILILALFPTLFAFVPCKNGKKSFTINGTTTFTESYCGGMRPTPEMEAELRTPKPLGKKQLFFRKGKTNEVNEKIVTSVISDDNGNFKVKLTPGVYCIVDERKKDRSYIDDLLKKHEKAVENRGAADKDCMEEWLKTPELVIEIDSKGKLVGQEQLSINFQRPCAWKSIPCVPFTGQLPR